MSILIQNVLLEDKILDVFIKGATIDRIGPDLEINADQVIDGRDKAILPSLINGHTHAAMTLLRGYADDMELHTWLYNYIWPLEAALTEEDVYVGAKLACLEMIKSGCTFFNDMYWHFNSTAQAVEDMGIRAALSSVFIDFNDPHTADRRWKECLQLYEQSSSYSQRIIFALGPHAVYSVSKESLIKAGELAKDKGLIIHMHLCETQKEVQDCLQQHNLSPVEYLNELGLLGPNLCACHCIWPSEKDMDLLADNKVKVIYNPISNLKLCSGMFPYPELKSRGLTIGLGTDGCSSNNNLDLLEEMKFAALTNKSHCQDPTLLSAAEVFDLATYNGAKIFGLQSGLVAEGKTADCILVDLNHPQLVPNYNLKSNLVYAANGDCVHTTICNGHILMFERKVEGEQEIIAQAKETADKLIKRIKNN